MPAAGPEFREVAPGSVVGPVRKERERVARIDLAVAVEVGGAVHAGSPGGAQREVQPLEMPPTSKVPYFQ